MASNRERWYPTHDPKEPVKPKELNSHFRIAFDNLYDLQTAMAQMTGGASALAAISGAAVTSVQVMFPGFGYSKAPTVTFTGGGGSGATATATISKGRVSSVTVTAGGAGYTSVPVVQFSQ